MIYCLSIHGYSVISLQNFGDNRGYIYEQLSCKHQNLFISQLVDLIYVEERT